jgi:hypothetical protein
MTSDSKVAIFPWLMLKNLFAFTAKFSLTRILPT